MSGTRFHKGAMHGINLARAATEPAHYIYDSDFFTQMDHTPAESSGGYISTEVGTATMVQTALLPGIALTAGTGGTDNNGLLLTRQTGVGAFDITIASGRELAFETKFQIVQGAEVAVFLGLCTSGPAVADLLAINTGILGNFDAIGFHCLMNAADVDVDGVSRILGGATQTGAETMTEDEDATFHVYGFRFDGNKTITWYLDNEVFTTQTIAAATFPTAQSLFPHFSIKTGEGVLKTMKIMDWQCVELLLSEDRLAD